MGELSMWRWYTHSGEHQYAKQGKNVLFLSGREERGFFSHTHLVLNDRLGDEALSFHKNTHAHAWPSTTNFTHAPFFLGGAVTTPTRRRSATEGGVR